MISIIFVLTLNALLYEIELTKKAVVKIIKVITIFITIAFPIAPLILTPLLIKFIYSISS